VRLADGNPVNTLLHQIRQDGENRSVFFCNVDRINGYRGAEVRLRGSWSVTELNTQTGQSMSIASRVDEAWTTFRHDFPGCGSLLISLSPGHSAAGRAYELPAPGEAQLLADPLPITLSEPNVLLLDQAE